MARIIVLGAGVGGMSAAYELNASLGTPHKVTVVGDGGQFSFTPSNPWVGIGWRNPADVQIDAAKALGPHGIEFVGVPASAVHPKD
ncbi:MAG: NAD(P)/FAD-dependent oxidoreductase, partial [Dokdonella sp.]